jgi:hypothetical protein
MKNLGVNMGSKRIVYKIHITFFVPKKRGILHAN